MLDVGCGGGRLASHLGGKAVWVGVDSSATQLAANPNRPVVRADMQALPFRDESCVAVTHLWCLYHVQAPATAIAEAKRVLRQGGRYYASTPTPTSSAMLGGYTRWSRPGSFRTS